MPSDVIQEIQEWFEDSGITDIKAEENTLTFLGSVRDHDFRFVAAEHKDVIILAVVPVFLKKLKRGFSSKPLKIGQSKILQVMTYACGLSMMWPSIHIDIDPLDGGISVMTTMIIPEMTYDDDDELESMRYRYNMLLSFYKYFINGLLRLLSENTTAVELYQQQVEEMKKDKLCKPFMVEVT